MCLLYLKEAISIVQLSLLFYYCSIKETKSIKHNFVLNIWTTFALSGMVLIISAWLNKCGQGWCQHWLDFLYQQEYNSIGSVYTEYPPHTYLQWNPQDKYIGTHSLCPSIPLHSYMDSRHSRRHPCGNRGPCTPARTRNGTRWRDQCRWHRSDTAPRSRLGSGCNSSRSIPCDICNDSRRRGWHRSRRSRTDWRGTRWHLDTNNVVLTSGMSHPRNEETLLYNYYSRSFKLANDINFKLIRFSWMSIYSEGKEIFE